MKKRNRKKNENEIKCAKFSQGQFKEACETVAAQFGKAILGKRKELKLSKRAIYRMASVSAETLTEIENGESLPGFKTLLRLVIALNIPLDFVFGEYLVPYGAENISPQEYFSKVKDIERNSMEDLRMVLMGNGLSETETNEIMNFIEYKVATKK